MHDIKHLTFFLVDDTAEIEAWTPHGIELSEGKPYPAQPAHSISCFTEMCRLSEIVNELLIQVYDPLQEGAKSGVQSALEELDMRLEEWWSNLPHFLVCSFLILYKSIQPDFVAHFHVVLPLLMSHLMEQQLQPTDLPEFCPPSHIVTLK